jgi:hypothetical protein
MYTTQSGKTAFSRRGGHKITSQNRFAVPFVADLGMRRNATAVGDYSERARSDSP